MLRKDRFARVPGKLWTHRIESLFCRGGASKAAGCASLPVAVQLPLVMRQFENFSFPFKAIGHGRASVARFVLARQCSLNGCWLLLANTLIT